MSGSTTAPASTSSASTRSSGVVNLKFARLPSTTRTRWPACSATDAVSTPVKPSSAASLCASRIRRPSKPCDVCTPLCDDGAPPLPVVVDPLADGWVHVEAGDVVRLEVAGLQRLVAGTQSPTRDPARDADRELLADLPVVVGEHVLRVRVHADDVLGLDLDAGLLLDLPGRGPADVLADLHHSARQGPPRVVPAALQEDVAALVDHDGRTSRDQPVGRRGAILVVVRDPSHSALCPLLRHRVP